MPSSMELIAHCRRKIGLLRAKLPETRQWSLRFGHLTSQSTFPTIEKLCTFENPPNIHVGKGVQFLKGCCVLANGGRIEIGDNSVICRFSVVQSVGGSITIGHDTVIGDFCNLFGQGGLVIGNNVAVASCVQIVPNQHTFDDPILPISLQPCQAKGIRIHDDCWIGTNVAILDGVEIGRGAVVGAGSVVTKDVPPYTIVVGVPAKVLRQRPNLH